MMKKPTYGLSILTAGAVLLALQGCGTASVSKAITDDGKASEVVFPDSSSAIGLPGGTFPNLDNLRSVRPGVTKDQLQHLVGHPHFSEGLANVREWDYLFHFRGAADAVTTCQYKVIFDQQYQARSLLWQPADCSAVLGRQSPARPPAPRQVSLDADGLFRFDGGTPADLLPEGRQKIQVLAAEIRRDFTSLRRVKVTGHTDRLGMQGYNAALSLARANTVRDLLVQHGMDASVIHTEGVGERQPVVNCPGTQASTELVRCLQPNRRVEIEAMGNE